MLQFGQVPVVYAGVSGSVFIDENRNGVLDEAELGFPGILLRLIDEVGEEVTAVTDSAGVFGFEALPGPYTLTMTVESGWFSTTPISVSLTLEEDDLVFVNFGSYFEAEVDETLYGGVVGVVFRDRNLDGALDEGEPGMSDVLIRLYDSEGVIVEEALSVEGLFIFSLVEPGEYTIDEILPEGFFNTTSALVPVTIEADTVDEVLFGLEDASHIFSGDDVDPDDAVVYGFVYNDNIGNRRRDAGEPGLEGVTLEVFEGGVSVSTAVTDENGFYVIGLGSGGTYRIVEHDPTGWESSTPNEVDFSAGSGDREQVNFGDRKEEIIEEEPDVSGVVFDDRDGDGLRDEGEPGIEGVGVELWLDETLLQETASDEDGAYGFIDLPLQVYTVKEVQPEGWFSTTPDEVTADLGDGLSEVVNFGDTLGAVISGTVYNDKNNNKKNDGEDGIPGVTVKLILPDVPEVSVVTDAEGEYSFTVYKVGSYTVKETQPAGFSLSTTPNNKVVDIVSMTGQTVTVDFGDRKGGNGPVVYTGTIRCYVFHDVDGDGEWDTEEPPIPGVDVDLYEDGDIIRTVTTNVDGLASFGKYETGSYKVVETDLEGWTSTTTNEYQFTLSKDEVEELKFGDKKGGQITGVVYNDANENEKRDTEEEGIEGVHVGLYLDGEPVDETFTSADGSYSFDILEPGDYVVEETDLEGWKSSTLNQVTVPVVDITQDYSADFGDYEYPFGDIWGVAFYDDGDEGLFGEKDTGESGIEGVVVSLYDEGGLVAATTTDEDGEYWFTELTPGIYEVRAAHVTDHFRTTPGSVMPEVDVGDEKEVNFGYTYFENEYGVVYGTVFNDADGDTGRSFGELGLGDVDVSLWLTEVLLTSDTTNEYGCYSIRIDEDDTYRLVETDLGGWYSTTPNELSFYMQTSNDNDSPWDFGDTLGATISGIVWDDENRDEDIDTEETGIEGVLVELYLGEVLVEDTLTASDGSYLFLVLASGDYTVEETDPEGYGSSTLNEIPVSIGELTGQTLVDKDFGDYVLLSSITGVVFDDLDGDGVQDGGEDGISGVTVSIYDESDVFVDSEETDENGEYLFELSILGRYKVEETNPEGYTSTTSDVVVVDLSEDDEETVNFGDRVGIEFAGIYGIVWDDEDGSGIREIELGIPDVTVNLYTVGEPNTFIESKTTNEHGQYTFTGLSIDDYLVEEINPDGWTSTTPDEVTVPVVDFTTTEVEYGDIQPSIGVWKYVIDPVSLDEVESVTVPTGTVVEYKFVVGNDGNVPLIDIVLVDDVLGPISLPLSILNPGEAMIGLGDLTHEITEDTVNTATVTATYVTPEEEEVEISDEDSASCYIGTIGLVVTKEVGKTGMYLVDDDWSSSAQILIDDTVYYRFIVENTGTLPLYALTVEDDVLGPILFDVPTLLSVPSLLPGEKAMNSEPVYVTAESGEHSNTVTATGHWLSEEASDTDSASYTGVYIEASLDLKVKGGDGLYYDYDAPVKAGEKVTYQYTISNTGTADLTGLGGHDDDSNYLNLPASVAAGADVTVEYTSYSDADPGPHSNGMLFYSSESEGAAIDGDDTSYFAEDAGVEITKEIWCRTCNDWHFEDAYVVAGEDVDYRFTVENTGNVELTNIIVTDDVLGVISMPGASLGPGGEMEKEVSATAASETHSNTVTVTGDTLIQTVSDDDESYYEPWSPSIELTKEVSIDEEEWYDYVEVTVDDTVFYRFTVENTGDVDLDDVMVEDLDLGDIDVGDLAPGETEYGYKNVAAVEDEHVNTATARGAWSGFMPLFESTDSASYFGVDASVEVDKKVKGGDDNWYDGPVDLLTGDPVEFQYTVTNTGNVELSDIEVVDDVLGLVTLDKTTLAPWETATGTKTGTVLSGSNTNTATATGHYEADTAPYTEWDPEDMDSASYFGGSPSITMDKQVKDIEGNWVDSATLPEDGTVNYRFVITNTGDVGLSGVNVYDPGLSVTGYSTDLIPGETTYGYADATVYLDLNPNEAHVEAFWGDYDVEYDAGAAYTGVQAYLDLTKLVKGEDGVWYDEMSGPAYVKVGESVEFRYIISNMCELPVKDVSLFDDELGWITLPSTDLAGWGQIDHIVTDTAVTGPYDNYAEAKGKCGDYNIPPDGASAYYYGVDISVSVDKQVKDPDGLWVDDTYAKVGETVEYRFVVENTGQEDLEIVSLVDDVLGAITVPTSYLSSGQSFTTDTVTATASAETHSNTVTVTASLDMFGVSGFDQVTDTDMVSYTGGVMGMTMIKEVSTNPGGPWSQNIDLLVDETVYYRFTVENTGDVPLSNVEVVDSHFGTIVDSLTLGVGDSEEYFEQVDYALHGNQENTVTADGDWNGVPEEAEDTASYFGVVVDAVFNKYVSPGGGDWYDDTIYVKTGEPVYYQFIVENLGNVDLTGVVIDDPDLVVLINVGTVLAGDTYGSPVETATALDDLHTNTATCNGETVLGPFAELEDSASYEGSPLTVSISVDKQVWDPPGWSDGPVSYKVGEEVRYRVVVTNTGEADLENIEVYDETYGFFFDLPSSTLASGASMTSSEQTVTAELGPHENTVEVSGDAVSPGVGTAVDDDTASYEGVPLTVSISVDKQVWDPVMVVWSDYVVYPVGAPISYRVYIKNTGETDLENIEAYDSTYDFYFDLPETTLASGEDMYSSEKTVTAQAGLHENTVEVAGDAVSPGVGTAEDDDSALYEGVFMPISVDKLVWDPELMDWSDGPVTYKVGDMVRFMVVVKNEGSPILMDITAHDETYGLPFLLPAPALLLGEEMPSGEITVTAEEGLHTNTAIVLATALGEGLVYDRDTASYEGVYDYADIGGVVWNDLNEDGLLDPGEPGIAGVTVTLTGPESDSETTDANGIYGFTVYAEGTYTVTETNLPGWISSTDDSVDVSVLFGDDKVVDFGDYEAAPEITVTKMVSLDEATWLSHVEAPVGDTVYFRFTLENTGNVELTDVSLVDTTFGTIASGLTLGVGDPSLEYTRDVVVSDTVLHENTATASGMWVEVPVEDTADASYQGCTVGPAITVTKEVSLDGVTGWTDHVDVLAGSTVWFRVRVENKGNVALTGVEVMDSMGTTPIVIGDMQPGEVWERTDSWIADPGDFENTATATGDYDSQEYSDDDSASVFGGVVDMKLTKYVKDPQGQWQDVVAPAVVGTTVEFKYVLENTGNVPVSVLAFYDDTLSIDFTTGTLDVGGAWNKFASTTAEPGIHSNQAKAEGHWNNNWVWVDDWAQYDGEEANPAVTVLKEVADSGGVYRDYTVALTVGDPVSYRYTVENTGNVPLTGVALDDDVLGGITIAGSLAPGASDQAVESGGSALEGEYTNTATVTAYYGSTEVSDDESATYVGETEAATIGGVVWNDLDKDTFRDPGEPGLEGVMVTLSGPESDTDTTDADGVYGFTVYTEGDYTVTETNPVGWDSSTPDMVDVPVEMGDDETVDFGDYERVGPVEDVYDYYVAYEDQCNNQFNDFGMLMHLEEFYEDNKLTRIEVEFTATIHDTGNPALVHLRRPIVGASSVTVERENVVPGIGPTFGVDETPAGVYAFDGEVDVVLYNLRKYSSPLLHIGEVVRVTIEVLDPSLNPRPVGLVPPRSFTNQASSEFYDLDSIWALYDLWIQREIDVGYHMSSRVGTYMYGYPHMYVPRILALDFLDWIPPYTETNVVEPYPFFLDYYRYGSPADWYMPGYVANNYVGPGGLSWGPYP